VLKPVYIAELILKYKLQSVTAVLPAWDISREWGGPSKECLVYGPRNPEDPARDASYRSMHTDSRDAILAKLFGKPEKQIELAEILTRCTQWMDWENIGGVDNRMWEDDRVWETGLSQWAGR